MDRGYGSDYECGKMVGVRKQLGQEVARDVLIAIQKAISIMKKNVSECE